MKKLLIATLFVVNCPLSIVPAHGASLCWAFTCAEIKTAWNNNNLLTGNTSDGTGYDNVPWTTTITGAPSGSINGVAKCTESNANAASVPSPNGGYCWCKVTSVSGVDICYDGSNAPWVLLTNMGSSCKSADNCVAGCSFCARSSSGACTRSALLSGW